MTNYIILSITEPQGDVLQKATGMAFDGTSFYYATALGVFRAEADGTLTNVSTQKYRSLCFDPSLGVFWALPLCGKCIYRLAADFTVQDAFSVEYLRGTLRNLSVTEEMLVVTTFRTVFELSKEGEVLCEFSVPSRVSATAAIYFPQMKAVGQIGKGCYAQTALFDASFEPLGEFCLPREYCALSYAPGEGMSFYAFLRSPNPQKRACLVHYDTVTASV